MKANVIKVLRVLSNLIHWAFTGVNFDKAQNRCEAYRRRWCKGEYCSYCNPLSEQEADELVGRIKLINNKENEI